MDCCLLCKFYNRQERSRLAEAIYIKHGERQQQNKESLKGGAVLQQIRIFGEKRTPLLSSYRDSLSS